MTQKHFGSSVKLINKKDTGIMKSEWDSNIRWTTGEMMLCFCFHVINKLLNKKQSKTVVYIMADAEHSLCFHIISQTDTRQDLHDCKWKWMYYFHSYLRFFHALVDILHESYEPDWDQGFGEKIMLVASGDSGVHFAS